MDRSSLRITIPTPCHEQWGDMTPTDQGAFCHSCATEVVDFAAMTDSEVLAYFEKGRVTCGRFREDQVDTRLRYPILDNGALRWKAFVLSILSLFSFRHSYGGDVPRSHTITQSAPDTTITKPQQKTLSTDSCTSPKSQPFYYKMGRVKIDHSPGVRPTIENLDSTNGK